MLTGTENDRLQVLMLVNAWASEHHVVANCVYMSMCWLDQELFPC